jgi:tRNA nucleotidyltransferase/poly(A) polymerase
MKKAARRIVEKLRLQGHEAFFAGGWVRDFLLHRKPKDIDIATSAHPEEVLELFPHSIPIGVQFGVVQVHMYGHAYEVATFRSDNAYLDGRHPSSVAFSSPEEDALRRDFTINGLFYDPIIDRVIDYVHGCNDLHNKLVRSIGNPHARFAEDKLRMLRAIRLACNLGFEIVPDTWAALQKLAPDILQVSWERIRDELVKLFTGPAPGLGLGLLQESGLLMQILPEVEAMRGIPQMPEPFPGADVFAHTQAALNLLRNPSSTLALGTLLHDVGKPLVFPADPSGSFKGHAQEGGKISKDICRRLRLSNEETDRIVDLASHHMELLHADEMRESALKKYLRRPDFADHLELFRVNCLSNKRTPDIYLNCLQKIKGYEQAPAAPILINGDDLIEMGYLPGPVFGEIIQTVEDLQLENELKTREEALQYVKRAFPLTGKT